MLGREPIPLPIVFSYDDYRLYVRDWLATKKLNNPRYSQRVLLRRAGIAGTGTLVNVIGGRRNLSVASAQQLAEAMDLGPEESRFFTALVRLVASEDATVRQAADQEIQATRRFRSSRVREEAGLEFLTHWYIPAVYELAGCTGFQADPAWIACRLRPRVTPEQAASAVDTLLTIGLLVRDGEGVARAHASLTTAHEVAGEAVRAYHAGMLDRAKDALAYDSDERHLCAVTVAIGRHLLPQLKSELDRFQERLLGLSDGATGDRQLVVQLNLQLVPLSHPTDAETSTCE